MTESRPVVAWEDSVGLGGSGERAQRHTGAISGKSWSPVSRSWWWFRGCIPLSKLIKLYAFDVCSSFYANYTSIKLSKIYSKGLLAIFDHWICFCKILLEIVGIATCWILFSLTHQYSGKHPTTSYSEIISVPNSPIESKKFKYFTHNFFHRILKSTTTFKRTYPNDYFIFQSFCWCSSKSSCRFWNLFHVIDYAANEVVMKWYVGRRVGRWIGSNFTIDFSIFYWFITATSLIENYICGSDKKSFF